MCADFSDSVRTRGSGEIRTLDGQRMKSWPLYDLKLGNRYQQVDAPKVVSCTSNRIGPTRIGATGTRISIGAAVR